MKNEYLTKFDAVGRRATSVPRILVADYGGEEKLLADGYIVISEEDWQHYVGNRGAGDNGTGYIRDAQTGKPVSAPLPTLPTVEVVAASTWEAVKAARDTAKQAGCPYMGKFLDSNSISVQLINTAVQAAQVAQAAKQPFKIDWTMQDNSVIEMSIDDVLGMPVALAAYSNQLHEKARQCRQIIEQVIADHKSGQIDADTARLMLSKVNFNA